ncbi:MAG: hypothetical protein KatS3mg108_0236 [Isosphaeraceae bacterium]|jgi:hypothetical protein|nr:MAG: hypothetical protein KatS3mg108_0236 [Isosphaeraceae bacterium]
MGWLKRFVVVLVLAVGALGAEREVWAGFTLTNPTIPSPPPPVFRPIVIGDPIFFWEIDVWFVGSAAGSQLKKDESYLTFYDIPGLIPGSNSQPGFPHPFAATFDLLGWTPTPAPGGLNDDPGLLNVTFRYVGNNTITLGAGQSLYLGKFSFLSDSTFDELPSFVQWVGTNPTQRGGSETSFERIRVLVPEPSSLALAIPGLVLFGLVAWRKRSSARL